MCVCRMTTVATNVEVSSLHLYRVVPRISTSDVRGVLTIETIVTLSLFGMIALVAKDIGHVCARIGLPLISGFMIVGVLAGPYVLGVVRPGIGEHLRFVDQFSLAFIAFAAGGELDLREVRGRLRSILSILTGQTVVVFVLGSIVFVALAPWIPFMQGMSSLEALGVGLLGATIMVARSPSSAYAIIKELRAKGPFTQTVLGVTVLKDALIIILFAINISIVAVLHQGVGFHFNLLFFVGFEIILDIALGILVGYIIRTLLAVAISTVYKSGLLLLIGYSIFFFSDVLREVHVGSLAMSVFSEPLLVGLVAGFVVSNYTPYKAEFHKILEDIAPFVFLLFFTLVGLSLQLEVLGKAWAVILVLVVVRLLGIGIGSFLGGTIAGDPFRQNVILGMTFITQAGVSVGLAKEVGVEFATWGDEFATLVIAMIVVNQLIGPPFMKWALHLVGEVHTRAETPEFDGARDAVICGIDDQALALARQLTAHGWQVKLAATDATQLQRLEGRNLEGHVLSDISLTSLQRLGLEKVETLVAMLDDVTNFAICELAYEHFGTKHLVVRLQDRANFQKFVELGALIVDPSTALVSLLDHFVRSPSATSLLLGQEGDQDVIEVVVGNRALHGVPLRDLRLPADTLVLSVRRHGHLILSHGYTRLELGDEVTVVGKPESLEEVQWRLEGFPYS